MCSCGETLMVLSGVFVCPVCDRLGEVNTRAKE